MPLAKITQVTGRGVYVPGNDIDTDRIIPARFMKCVSFDGLGEFLFYDVRKNADGTDRPHPLNDPRFQGAIRPPFRRQLRLRFVARARAAGAPEIRFPRRHRREFRRDFLRQLHDARLAVRLREPGGHPEARLRPRSQSAGGGGG
jgi:hypothetical protein